MSLARNALLWISENRKLRATLPRYKFVRRAVTRFMPGEELSDAVRAAKELQEKTINTIFTRLGENIADREEARAVAGHYSDSLREIKKERLDTYVSVKLTQLGLELSEDVCYENLVQVVEEAERQKNRVWIDMEQSGYVDRTLGIYRRIRSSFSNVGVCLQAYLYRTQKDIEDLLPLKPSIRLVKGAYAEPATVAFPKKADVDANFFSLSKLILEHARKGVLFGIATHDPVLISRLQWEAQRQGLGKDEFEFQLLYGIKTDLQRKLAEEGYRVRSLISYGSFWFPWYVRRLAERPANVLFVAKSILAR
ncbi:MAG TPA: proline dehydrogenase family protein [Bacteroidota bacterium]|nr:proline dehydrogenase family protein [Bacteroidota bacterium]